MQPSRGPAFLSQAEKDLHFCLLRICVLLCKPSMPLFRAYLFAIELPAADPQSILLQVAMMENAAGTKKVKRGVLAGGLEWHLGRCVSSWGSVASGSSRQKRQSCSALLF